jgi:hypothetical protein
MRKTLKDSSLDVGSAELDEGSADSRQTALSFLCRHCAKVW